jgi:CheY-like chemotaxis protein
VDDEPDILETVEDELYMCILHKASDFESAKQYLISYRYDIVILDIMGVNGFDLLKISTLRGFPTVMLTAHALTEESLKKSIQLGAVFFMPKETLPELRIFLEELVLNKFKPSWMNFFDRLSSYFVKYFGPRWKDKEKFSMKWKNFFRRARTTSLRKMNTCHRIKLGTGKALQQAPFVMERMTH